MEFTPTSFSFVSVTQPASVAALKIVQQGNASASVSVGGAINLDNSLSTGAGMVIYSTQAAPAGRLLVVNANNATFNQAALNVQHAGSGDAIQVSATGTGQGLNLTADAGATAGKHAMSVGLTNTGSSNSSALSISSTNLTHSCIQVTGTETGKGTIKVTHTGQANGSDGNASALSIDLQTAGTAAQGIFIDATTGATTGKLLHIKNGGAERLSVLADGKIQFGNSANFATTVGAAGGASALPATPVKYVIVQDDAGSPFKIPVYNV